MRVRSAGKTQEGTCRYILLPQTEWDQVESGRGLMRHGGLPWWVFVDELGQGGGG